MSLQGIMCPVSFETLWSLSYEVWFYILICAFGYILSNSGKWKVLVGLMTFTICMIVFTKLDVYYLFIWIIGALGFFIAPYRNRAVCITSIILTLIVLGVLQITSETQITMSEKLISSNSRPIIKVCFGSIFYICLSQIIQYAPLSRIGIKLNNLGTKLAAFSYTLYLTHIPIRDLLCYLGAPKSTSLTPHSIALYILWLCIALMTAYGVYYLFERNTTVIKKWLRNKFKYSGGSKRKQM